MPAFDVPAFERFVATTDGEVEGEIRERTRAFFQFILSKYCIGYEWPWVETPRRPIGVSDGADERLSDNNMSALIVRDETLALVLDRRTVSNMHEVTFFEREPSQELLAWRDTVLESEKRD